MPNAKKGLRTRSQLGQNIRDFTDESRSSVYQALCSEPESWHDVRDVKRIAVQYQIESPIRRHYSVFEWSDRLHRHLNTLTKRGMADKILVEIPGPGPRNQIGVFYKCKVPKFRIKRRRRKR